MRSSPDDKMTSYEPWQPEIDGIRFENNWITSFGSILGIKSPLVASSNRRRLFRAGVIDWSFEMDEGGDWEQRIFHDHPLIPASIV